MISGNCDEILALMYQKSFFERMFRQVFGEIYPNLQRKTETCFERRDDLFLKQRSLSDLQIRIHRLSVWCITTSKLLRY
jgi:hypothetical protein